MTLMTGSTLLGLLSNKLSDKLENFVRSRINSQNQRNNNKKKFSDFIFQDRIKNLSGVDFSAEEMNLLNKGIKYCVRPKITGDDVLLVAVEMNVAIENISKDLKIKNSIRGDISSSVEERPNINVDHKILHSIRKKIKNLSSNLH